MSEKNSHPRYSVDDIHTIVRQFEIGGDFHIADFMEKGNINQYTYLVTPADGDGPEYLLQQINKVVFTRPRNVMASMSAALDTQRGNLPQANLPPGMQWEPITLVPAKSGDAFVEHEEADGDVNLWRLMLRIPDCVTYKKLSEAGDRDCQLSTAYEAGMGLAVYFALTSNMVTDGLVNPLPGYRDTDLYYRQLHSILDGNRTEDQAVPYLPTDELTLGSTRHLFYSHISPEESHSRCNDPILQKYIRIALDNEAFGRTLSDKLKQGDLKTVAVHGDTKLENYLFSRSTGKVISLIDLDTIMPQTWLSDWGDMVRSLSNPAGEKEPDMENVIVDLDVYGAVARGFLSAVSDIPEDELTLMADAVEIQTLELGVRFLADYLRGDNYFVPGKDDPKDINRIRAMVQLTLFERLRALRQDIDLLLQYDPN